MIFSSSLTTILAVRWHSIGVAVATVASAGLLLGGLTAIPAAAATSPQPAPGQVAGVTSTYWNTLHVFYQAADHTLVAKTTSQSGGWAVERLGGRLTSGPAAITIGSELDSTFVFARGTDNAIWVRSVGGRGIWGPWKSLGGRALGAPAVSGTGDVTHPPAIWARGTDGALWQRGYAFGGWRWLGGRLISDPAAVPAVGGSYPAVDDVFALGTDHAVWEYTNAAWHKVGGQSTVAPAVVALSNWQTYLFTRGTDNALWVTTRAPTATLFGPWQKIGGKLASAPTATIYPYTGTGQALCVFALGTDGNLWQARHTLSGGGWTWNRTA